MASVFKRVEDKRDRNAPWRFHYRDEDGKRKYGTGFRDKAQTERMAAQLEDAARKRRMDPRQSRIENATGQSIEVHLADFEQYLKDKANTPKHVKLTLARVRAVVKGCQFKTLGEIVRSKVATWIAGQIGPKQKEMKKGEKQKIGNRTGNHYAQAVEEFGIWLMDDHRLHLNPFAGLPRWNTEVDVRHARRALTAEELARFLQAARHSPKSVQCYNGEQRYRVYRIACATGLRKSEIASLSSRSFNLSADPPTVTVQAAFSKHRRQDTLPLHPDLAAELPDWLVGLDPDALLFPGLARKKTFRMVQHDLATAKIAYVTEDGGHLDFHGLRHSFITHLLLSGASIIEARDLARHTDIRMTGRYAQLNTADKAAALGNMSLPQITHVHMDVSGRVDVFSIPSELQETQHNEHLNSDAQRRRSADVVRDSPFSSLPVPNQQDQPTPRNDDNPRGRGGYVCISPVESVTDCDEEMWRRRESNPRP